jgi:Domain of unknown function (DUF4193)
MPDEDDFDDDEPELDDDVDLEEEEDDELDLDVDAEGDTEEEIEVVEGEEPVVERAPRKGARPDEGGEEEEDDVVDLEEELHPDDVEEPLDVLLHEKTSSDRLEEEATELEDDELEPDERGEATGRVVPRRDDEFLCRSCFLVKPLSQLARGETDLCRDCE